MWVRWQERARAKAVRRCPLTFTARPYATSTPSSTFINVHQRYQRSSTFINVHQRSSTFSSTLSTFINVHQRSSTFINAHQRSSTFINAINVHQRSSTFINAHQRSSTLINAHQHIRDAPKHSSLYLLSALVAGAVYYCGWTSIQ